MPSAHLTIAGAPSYEEGEAESVLRWSAAREDRVEVLPHYIPVDQVAELFGRARVVVLPYLVGYQSGVLHLAMTMARAVVISDVGDLGSAVHAGETGLLVPPGEVSTLAAALEELLNDAPRANQMGLAARARLERGSSWQLVAERMSAALHG
jgi:glycosyltransferase involved in cell wall biosynthesis